LIPEDFAAFHHLHFHLHPNSTTSSYSWLLLLEDWADCRGRSIASVWYTKGFCFQFTCPVVAVLYIYYLIHEIRKRKANWIGHILRRNCLLKEVIGGKIKGQIEVTRRRGRRRKKLLDDLGDRRGYYHLKEEALDRIKWRNRFGRGCGPVIWPITDDDDELRLNGLINKRNVTYKNKLGWLCRDNSMLIDK
jgi:hypothetical protein